jgi:hypothetical protein
MSLADENRYYETVLAMESLFQQQFDDFTSHIFLTQGRPAEAVFRIVPATIQGILYKMRGISPANFDSLKIPVFFNILVHLLILYMLYRISLLIFKNRWFALLTVVLYKLLINPNVYIRHILPYEKSLLCFLILLFLYLYRNDYKKSRYFVLGLLCAIAIAIYPGYYFIPVFLGLLVFKDEIILNNNFRLFIQKGILIFSGFLSVVLTLELISAFGAHSYINSCLTLSETISQGSYDESLLFPLKYLTEVEGVSGILLLVSVTITLLLSLIQLRREKTVKPILNEPVIALLLLSISGMLLHGIMGTVFHKMVFYGRLMHLYIPFLVLTLVYVIHQSRFSRGLSIVTLLIFMTNFFFFSLKYFKLGYPKSMLYAYKIDNRNFSKDRFYNETDSILYPLLSPNALNKETNHPYSRDTGFLLVNCALITPITDPNDYRKFLPDSGLTLLASQPYYFAFPAYSFEGLSTVERKHAKERNYHIQFYSTSD